MSVIRHPQQRPLQQQQQVRPPRGGISVFDKAINYRNKSFIIIGLTPHSHTGNWPTPCKREVSNMRLISNYVLRIELKNKFWAAIIFMENLFWNLFAYIIILEMSPMPLTFVLQAASKQHLNSFQHIS